MRDKHIQEAAAVAARAVTAAKKLSRLETDESDVGEIIGRNPINVFNGVVVETFGSKSQVPHQANINTFRRKAK